MANLITKKQKKVINNEYYCRLISAVLILLSILGLFILAYVVPYYIYVKNSYLETIKRFEAPIAAENNENAGESMSQIVRRTLDEMKAIELYYKTGRLPSDYLASIIEQKNSKIKIYKLSFNFVKADEGQIIVGGLSENRQGLVNFIDDLKSLENFVGVNSPVSDFAKDSDIAFTLNIKIKI
jgi:hypothetical protein